MLDVQGLPYVGDPVSYVDYGSNLADALAQLSAAPEDGGAILRPATDVQGAAVKEDPTAQGENSNSDPVSNAVSLIEDQLAAGAPGADLSALDDEVEPSFILYEPDMPGDDGGGYVEVYEPLVYAPEGYSAEDLYAIEFVHNELTGELTINLYFGVDPLAVQGSAAPSLTSPSSTMGVFPADPGLGVSPLEAGPGANCTVTITRTTTQNSSSYTVNFNTGVVNGTRTSGSTSTTTTTSITAQGTLINGRCVVRNGTR